MSNRILWILILFIFFITGYIFYQYFYVINTVKLIISSNVDNYQVELYAKKIGQTFNYECNEKKCVLENISPYLYQLEIKKIDYISYKTDIEIIEKQDYNLEINLEKKVYLEKIELENELKNISENEIPREEKIENIKNKNKYYFITNLLDGRKFYFEEKDWKLDLIYKENKIWTFNKVSRKELNIKKVYENNNFIFIKIAENKYLYNLALGDLEQIKLGVPVNYIKKWFNDKLFLFITSKWTYKYSLFKKTLEYFVFFKDFLYINDYYIWIINKDEKTKLKNLWLEEEKENLIIKYNPNSKEKKVLFRTSLTINKLIKNKDKIIIIDEKSNKYELKNY